MLNLFKTANLALAFLLELGMLVAFGVWGFHTGQNTLTRIALGIGVLVLAAVFWGVFMAPKAVVPLPAGLHLIVALLLFGLAAVALAFAGQPTLAWIFAALVVLNQVLMWVWKQ